MFHDWGTLAALMAVVAVASACQNLTGFAFSLIFVGVVGALELMPIADVANVAGMISLVNGAVYLHSHPFQPRWDWMRPMLISSAMGVLAGLALLYWLSGEMVGVLRLLLGVTIMACAVVLLLQKRQRRTESGAGAMWVAGGLSGLLGGLFSTSGPPMVYHLYRQPLSAAMVRQCLMVMSLTGTVMRLGVLLPTGALTWSQVGVTAMAFPVVAVVTWVLAKFPPPLSARTLQWLVGGLLMVAGASLLRM